MAQGPTITSAALPQLGYTYNMLSDTVAVDRITFTVSPGSGTAQTWNYTTPFVTTFADPTAFVSPAGHPSAATFTNATMASANITTTPTTWVYWVVNSTGLYMDGVYTPVQGTPTTINFTPNPAQMPVPFTYTSTPVVSNCTATFTVLVSGLTATVHHRLKSTITPDAFGTLTTPAGTYSNTLRAKTYQITSDSAYVFGSFAQAQYDTTTNYSWYQNTQDALLMSIDKSHTGAVTKASYLQSFTTGLFTVNQPTASFNLFPNPASDMTYFMYENKTSGMVNLTLIDITGKQIAVLVNEEQALGKQKVAINIATLNLPKGLYFLQLNSNNNLQTVKLSVN
jgi:hypothetical protein